MCTTAIIYFMLNDFKITITKKGGVIITPPFRKFEVKKLRLFFLC